MATTAASLIQRTRRLLRDWPELDTLTASLASGGAALTVADGTRYNAQELVEIDQEVMRVTAAGSGTSASVQRGLRGSAAASHANAATVLMSPRFFAVEILDELNNGLDACYPRIYRRVVDETLTNVATDTYEFTLPSSSSVPIPYVEEVAVRASGDITTRWLRNRGWEVIRGSTPKLRFSIPPAAGATIRVVGVFPFAHFASITDAVDAQFPTNAESLLPLYAAAALLDSAEAARVRQEVGAIDSREQATAVASSSRQASKLQQRFYAQLERWAMAPPAKSVRFLS